MKKRIVIGIMSILFILTFILLNDCSKEDKGLKLAINVDNKKVSQLPTKGAYEVSVSCDGADGKWDYVNWQLLVENIRESASCDVDFKTSNAQYLDELILSKVGTDVGNGTLEEPLLSDNTSTGIRYIGEDPNNYALFNNELWRIIGVFDENTHKISGKKLVKLIRVGSIGVLKGQAFSDMKPILQAFYEKQDISQGVRYEEDGYVWYESICDTCDYSYTGLNAAAKIMVENASWYLSSSPSGSNASTWYSAERSSTSTKAYVGLAYASDAFYTVDSTTNKGWLHIANHLMSNSSYGLFNNGLSVSNVGSSFYTEVYPALYLSDSVYTYAGTGEINNPYILEI